MKRWLPLLVGMGLVLLGGIAHGVWSNRWGDSQAVDAAAARLTRVPHTVGDWEGTDLQTDPRALAIGEIVGCVNRRYENRLTGQAVTALLVCGKSGPIAVHTPDVCYGGAGYALTAPPVRQIIPATENAPSAAFWTAKVRKQNTQQTMTLRVCWTWNANGQWEAPDNPRLKFGHHPSLYKLYVVRELAPDEDESAPGPEAAFLQCLVSELQRSL